MKNLKLTLLAFTLLLPLAAFADISFTNESTLKAGRLDTDYGSVQLNVVDDESEPVTEATCELVDGELPDGLSLSEDCTIFGTVNETITAGYYKFKVKASYSYYDDDEEEDVTVESEETDFTITIKPKLEFTTATLPYGRVNGSYSATISSTESDNLTFEMESSATDLGIGENNGTITGTLPSTSGPITAQIKVTDEDEYTATQSYTIHVLPELAITSPATTITKPEGSIEITLTSSDETYASTYGITLSVTWEINDLPAGLSLSGNTITGNLTEDEYTFTAKVTGYGGAESEADFTLTIEAEEEKPTPEIATSSPLPAGTVGEPYTQTLELTTSISVTWSISSGSLPLGLSLNPSTGVISGTPMTADTYTFTVTATPIDISNENVGTREFNITINSPTEEPPTFTSPSFIYTGKVGSSINWEITADQSVTWSIVSGRPSWILITSGLSDRATLSSSAISDWQAGEYKILIRITNTNNVSAEREFTITVPPTFTPSSINAVVGKYIEWDPDGRLTADQNVIWSVVSKPSWLGLAYDETYSVRNYNFIYGTPTEAGSFDVTIKVTNPETKLSSTQTITIVVKNPEKPVIPDIVFENGEKDIYYESPNLAVEAGDYAWWEIVGGNLPPGLYLSTSSGRQNIYGTPTQAGTYPFTVKASNEAGIDTKQLSITIDEEKDAPIIYGEGSVSETIDIDQTREYGISTNRPANWSISGDVVQLGLSLYYPTGYRDYNYIEIEPTEVGVWYFTVTATNGAGYSTKTYTVEVMRTTEPPIIDYAYLNSTYYVGNNFNGYAYSDRKAKWEFDLSDGDIPPGLGLYIRDADRNYIPYDGSSYVSEIYLRGTATRVGDYTFYLVARNDVAPSDPCQLSVTVEPRHAPEFNPPFEKTFYVGEQPRWELSTNNWQSVTWSVVGEIPEWLRLYDYGQNNYTYLAATRILKAEDEGDYTVRIRIEDAYNGSNEADFTIHVELPPAPTIITDGPFNAVVGREFGECIEADQLVTWSKQGFPTWLNYDEQEYYWTRVYGIPPESAAGVPQTFTLNVISSVTGLTGTKTFTINVRRPNLPVITTTSMNGEKGVYFSQPLEATDVADWSLVSGNLPPGLSLGTGGYISGHPTAAGTYDFFVRAENATGGDTKPLSITIIDEQSAPGIYYAEFYNDPINIGSNFSGEGYSNRLAQWRLDGDIPPGLGLYYYDEYSMRKEYDGSVYTRNIYFGGTATQAGNYSFNLVASNSRGSNSNSLSITVNAGSSSPTINYAYINSSVDFGDNFDGYGYSDRAAQWRIDGDIPPGLKLYDDYGEYNGGYTRNIYFEGTATQAGSYTFNLIASNDVGNSAPYQLSVTVKAPPSTTIPEIADITLQGEVNSYYSSQLRTSNGISATWSIESGSLPPGLELSTSWWSYISGTPTEAGSYKFLVKAEYNKTSENGENRSYSGTRWFTITIVKPAKPEIATATLPTDKIVGSDYEAWLETDNDVQATWSIESGVLPPGLSLSTGGYISGEAKEAGSYKFLVMAENASGSSAKWFTITVTEPKYAKPEIDGITDSYTVQVNQSRTLYLQNSWSLESGSLPTGMYINGYSIYGTPTDVGTYRFLLKTENGPYSVSKWFTITVTNPTTAKPDITNLTLPDGTEKERYSASLSTTGNVQATWSIESGVLPPGLTLSGSSISGYPKEAGSYKFLLKAENARGSSTKWFTIKINEPPKVIASNFSVGGSSGSILLSNIPANTNLEVFNIQGKRVYFGNTGNSQTMKIPVQTGMYIVKIGSQKLQAMVR